MRSKHLYKIAASAVLAVAVSLTLEHDARGQNAPPTDSPAHDAAVPNRAPLEATPMVRLPLGSVRAEGWLLRQLQLQKSGLTGAAEGLYDALTPDSGWLGGGGESWEKGPYYVKGLIALAYTLDDDLLKRKSQKWVDWALQSQRPDGFFGPTSNDDWWPRMVVLFYLRDYYEATGDERVIPFLTNYFHHQLQALPGRPLRDWGRARAGDNIDVVLWTYNRTGDKSLLDLAKLLYNQAYPWTSIYADNRFYDFGDDFHPHHIVNVSQALKMPPVSWQVTHDPKDKAAFAKGVANLDRQYGRIDGQVSGTEFLSNLSSTAGVELCADAERIDSNGIAVRILGDPALGDQMEKVAYNSLPAHTSPTAHAMTYYQFPNQVACTFGGHGFTQDYANGNMPGPHSGFPCCCYNWHMAWPKLVQNMWAATPDGGLVLVAYGPNRVSTTVAGGVPVTVTQTTDYPFKESVTLAVEPQKAVRFPLLLRVPGWCDAATVAVNGAPVAGVKAGTFHRVEREWKPGDTVEIRFPMKVRTSTWINDSVGVERGPLAFSLKISEQWKASTHYAGDFDEYAILPQSPWNFALRIDRDVPQVEVEEHPIPQVPFDHDAPPVVLKLDARQVAEWGMRPARGKVELGKSDASWRSLRTADATLEADKPHRVRVVAKGDLLRVFVDDMQRPLLEQRDATFPTGGIGLRTYDAAARFDDVTLNGRVVADFSGGDAARQWATFGGSWVTRDGDYEVAAAQDGKAVYKPAKNLRDFTLEATVTVAAGGNAGLMFRVSDPAEALDGYRGYYVGLAAGPASEDSAEPPQSPVAASGPLVPVELIPFGSTKLRVSYFPVLGGTD